MSQTQENDYALLTEVFAHTASAIVVVNESGVISKANHTALALLGEPVLEGRRWVEVISRVFRPRNDDGHEISTRDGRRLQVITASLSSGQLIQMNDLTETRLLQDKISHMERLSSLGRMAASLAHQIRTPLSAAMLYAANLGNANLQPMARKRFQEKLVSRLEALEAQVSDILMFARSNEQTVSEIDARQLAEQAASNVTAVLSKGGAELITELSDEEMPVMGNATALTGALSNLIANAVEAGAKKVCLRLMRSHDNVVISVANDGPVIPDELKEKIFEPFYTSKSSGTGLGLAVVSAVTKVHQGVLTLEKWNDTFATVFTISIPLFNSHQAGADAPEGVPASTDLAASGPATTAGTAMAHGGAMAAPAGVAAAATAAAAGSSDLHADGHSQSALESLEKIGPGSHEGSGQSIMASAAAAAAAGSAALGGSAAAELLSARAEAAAEAGIGGSVSAAAVAAAAAGAAGAAATDSVAAGAAAAADDDKDADDYEDDDDYESSDDESDIEELSDDDEDSEDTPEEVSRMHESMGFVHASGQAAHLERSVLPGAGMHMHDEHHALGLGTVEPQGMHEHQGVHEHHVNFGSLPQTAAGISKQAATAANTATSEAFAAYARKRQEQAALLRASEAQGDGNHVTEDPPQDSPRHDGYTHVQVDVSGGHKLNS